jgi:hypothetical protein
MKGFQMFKKIIIPLILIPLLLVLAACGSSETAATATTSGSTSSTIQDTLAAGIFKLEDTDLAITATQAGELLPLWKAVLALSTDDNTADEEMQALYAQIQENLTTGQVQAIQEMALTDDDLITLIKQVGGQSGTGSGSETGTGGTTSGGFIGGAPGVGMPGDAPGGVVGGVMMGGMPGEGSSGTTATQVAGQTTGASQMNINLVLAQPLIELLKQRVNI